MNKTEEEKADIIAGLKRNEQEYGKRFCPCVPPHLYEGENADDYVCGQGKSFGCKQYREEGICHCGLYPEVRRGNL